MWLCVFVRFGTKSYKKKPLAHPYVCCQSTEKDNWAHYLTFVFVYIDSSENTGIYICFLALNFMKYMQYC